MTAIRDTFRRLDWPGTVALVALAALGVVLIKSAGGARASAALQNLWVVHAWTAAAGFALYFALAAVDYRKILDWGAKPFYAAALALLVAVLAFGAVRYGGRRWLWFFQPSEIAKPAVILLVASVFGRAGDDAAAAGRYGWKGALAGAAILGVPAALILAEPDLGTALVLAPAVAAMLLAARVWTKGLVALLLAGVLATGAALGTLYVAERRAPPGERPAIYRCVPLKEHQIKRLRVFLNREHDIRGDGYNLRQARISIASGSWRGKGLGKGALKQLGYLPPAVAMNDFIFAVLAEELGFRGCAAMLGLFTVVLLGGMATAFRCDDDRGRLLAVGVCTLIFCHVYVNVAMSIGLMPITGLPLPFISAGRTFLIVATASLGLVQSVRTHTETSNRKD